MLTPCMRPITADIVPASDTVCAAAPQPGQRNVLNSSIDSLGSRMPPGSDPSSVFRRFHSAQRTASSLPAASRCLSHLSLRPGDRAPRNLPYLSADDTYTSTSSLFAKQLARKYTGMSPLPLMGMYLDRLASSSPMVLRPLPSLPRTTTSPDMVS